jgi:hypothetical protein
MRVVSFAADQPAGCAEVRSGEPGEWHFTADL